MSTSTESSDFTSKSLKVFSETPLLQKKDGNVKNKYSYSESLFKSNDDEHSNDEEDSIIKTYSAEDAIEHYGFGFFQLFLLIMCGIVWMVDAMEIILLSFLMPAIKRDWDLSSFESSAVGSVAFIGMLGGAYFWGFVSDRVGRKVAITCMLLFTLFFGIASALSPSFWFLLIIWSLWS